MRLRSRGCSSVLCGHTEHFLPTGGDARGLADVRLRSHTRGRAVAISSAPGCLRIHIDIQYLADRRMFLDEITRAMQCSKLDGAIVAQSHLRWPDNAR